MTNPDDSIGFDKQATLDDTDDSMVKRGVVEDPDEVNNVDGLARQPGSTEP